MPIETVNLRLGSLLWRR